MKYIGPHVSISSSVSFSPGRAKEKGATGFAIFTKNQRQWQAKMLDGTEAESFKRALTELGFDGKAVLPHAGYLINPATPDEELRAKSLNLFLDEATRCQMLGIDVLNLHPGAYKEGSAEEGIKRSADMIDKVLEAKPGLRVAIENTSGSGTIIGSSFEELDALLCSIRNKDRVGFTLDTAHLYGAGYDVKSDVDKILDGFFSRFGTDKLFGMHLNDSKVPLQSKKDRHASLGKGLIGTEPFLIIARRKETDDIPLILETPDESLWENEIRMLLNECP